MLCTVTALGGCSSAADEEQPPAGPVSAATTVPVQSTCGAVAAEARAFAAELGQMVTDDASVDQLRTTAADLAGAVGDAKATVGPAARASLDEAGHALDRMQDALATDPIDWVLARGAADDLVTALRGLVDLCAADSSTPPSAPTS